MYLLIWGTRSPVLAEPLLTGTRWNTVGGAANDVASRNRYEGREKVTVPAFPAGGRRGVESVTQTGALGDPFGSGRARSGGCAASVRCGSRSGTPAARLSEAVLRATTLTPKPLPPDSICFRSTAATPRRSAGATTATSSSGRRSALTVAEVVNNTARVDVKQVSGPITVAGSYAFSTRLDGVAQPRGLRQGGDPGPVPRTRPARRTGG